MRLASPLLAAAIVCLADVPVSAQPVGTFRWQLAPHCNVLTLRVTHASGTYRLEGADDRCGVPPLAPVTGFAVPNADGTFEVGFTIVTASGPQHVEVTLHPATLSGPWQDSGGNTGVMAFNPGPISGGPRPVGLGVIAINPGQVQARVHGACGPGESIQSVGEDGSVTCSTGGGGDITSVQAGPGLAGGGTTGAVALSVDTTTIQARVNGSCAPGFYVQGVGADGSVGCMPDASVALAGSGMAPTAAHSDHTHEANASSVAIGPGAFVNGTGAFNTAVGVRALSTNTIGSGNTGIGVEALTNNVSGGANTAIGSHAMLSSTTASNNTALGAAALAGNQTGWNNVAIGAEALVDNTVGEMNVGVGSLALANLTAGDRNVAVGEFAGINLTTGSNNILISNPGGPAESQTIRIGTEGVHTATYIAGILGGPSSNQATVLIDTVSGQLGVPVSSARFKEEIASIGDQARRVQALRPVSFIYKPEFDSGAHELQYGLIAEEVNGVMPELVARDAEGRPYTVRYHLLAPLLLAEVQRLERQRAAQDERLTRQEEEMNRLRKAIEVLKGSK